MADRSPTNVSRSCAQLLADATPRPWEAFWNYEYADPRRGIWTLQSAADSEGEARDLAEFGDRNESEANIALTVAAVNAFPVLLEVTRILQGPMTRAAWLEMMTLTADLKGNESK